MHMKTIIPLAVAALSASVASAAPQNYAADVSTPEKRAALTERLWAHDTSTDVRIWPAERLKPDAEAKPFAFTEKELAQSNLVIGDVLNPQLSFFPANGEGRHPAAIVFPGGGYHVLGWNKEGTEIANWLNSLGFSAFVLLYRTDDRDGALADAQRAMGLIRRDAEKYGVDPTRIGVIGFSAGANLAVRLSTNWRKRMYERVDEADDLSCRPDFMLPIYPWDLRLRVRQRKGGAKSMEIAAGYPIDAETPPSFTVQAVDDFCEVETAVALDFALRKAGVQSVARIYPNGGHGYGLRRLGKATDIWSCEAASWLAQFAVPKPNP